MQNKENSKKELKAETYKEETSKEEPEKIVKKDFERINEKIINDFENNILELIKIRKNPVLIMF